MCGHSRSHGVTRDSQARMPVQQKHAVQHHAVDHDGAKFISRRPTSARCREITAKLTTTSDTSSPLKTSMPANPNRFRKNRASGSTPERTGLVVEQQPRHERVEGARQQEKATLATEHRGLAPLSLAWESTHTTRGRTGDIGVVPREMAGCLRHFGIFGDTRTTNGAVIVE